MSKLPGGIERAAASEWKRRMGPLREQMRKKMRELNKETESDQEDGGDVDQHFDRNADPQVMMAHQSDVSLRNEQETATEVGRIQHVIQRIDAVTLEPDYADDEQQQHLLEDAKRKARVMIEKTLQKAAEYIDIVAQQVKDSNQGVAGADRETVKARVIASDIRRTQKHNAFMSDLRSTIRFISHVFGDISEEAIDRWMESLEERGGTYIHTNRVPLPRNVLCPDSIDLSNRKSIAAWGEKVVQQLQTQGLETASDS
jgi:hypothetical protein